MGSKDGERMIARIWHGWTTHAKADQYQALLQDEIFAGIRERGVAGLMGIQSLRRDLADEVEFVTIMQFDSTSSIRDFAGRDQGQAVVPAKTRALLSRFDERSQHYEIVD